MSEHLERETLSALIDEPGSDPAAAAHLETCDVCSHEHEVMRRMRMALSAMGQLEAPVDAWDAIEPRLPYPDRRGRWLRLLTGDGWVGASVRAAAAVVLFAGGVALGLRAGDRPGTGAAATGGGADAGLAAARPTSGPTPGAAQSALAASSRTDLASTGATPAGASVQVPANLPEPYRAVFSRLEALRTEGPSASDALRDPQAAAQHLARLDALIRASREALRDVPADPAVNDFLFQVVAERNALDRVLHVASLEYR
jgi:hypothetical protein